MDNSGYLIPPPTGASVNDGGFDEMDRNDNLGGGTVRDKQHSKDKSSAESELRLVAETLSRTGKVLGAGLAQANEQGQRLRGAISRLERSNDWSTAERKRAEDDISSFFNMLHETLRAKEDEMLRDVRGVYAVQDEDNKRRLEELVIQGQKLSKSCLSIQALHEGTSNATIGSLNSPLNSLLEALESSNRILEKEEELVAHENAIQQKENASSAEERGVKFHFCNDNSIRRDIESIEMVQFEGLNQPVVLVGTPDSIEAESSRLHLSSGKDTRPNSARPMSQQRQRQQQQQQQQQQQARAGRQENQAQRYDDMSRGMESLKLNGETDFPIPRSSAASSPAPRTRDLYRGHASRSVSPPQNGSSEGGHSTNKDLKVKTIVSYDEDRNNQGILYFLGTKAGSGAFSNPALFSPEDDNLVVLRASSRIEGDLASLAGFKHQEGAFFETDSALSSWVSVELPSPLLISHYTLGYYISGQEHIPRNWVLQGSNDNVSWTTLKVHENDMALDNHEHLATWAVQESGPYRFFRVMQTGPTSTGTMFLVLSFLELYGTLFFSP